jgi:hypothetical protein
MPLSRQGKDTPFSVLTANTLGNVSLIDKGNKKETRADLSRHGKPKQNTRGKCSDSNSIPRIQRFAWVVIMGEHWRTR